MVSLDAFLVGWIPAKKREFLTLRQHQFVRDRLDQDDRAEDVRQAFERMDDAEALHALVALDKRRRGRKGISLIEVLMAIFIVSFGILSVFSLIYFGAFQVQRGLDADASAIAANSFVRDFEVRAMNSVFTWRLPAGGQVDLTTTGTGPLNPTGARRYVIDPRSVARGVTGSWPAQSGATTVFTRLSIGDQVYKPNPSPPPQYVFHIMATAQADEAFSAQNDIAFDDTKTNFPSAMEGNNAKRYAGREYSWFAMLTREGTASQYELSIVVQQGRFAPVAADEVEVNASMTGGGFGGGDFKLTGTATTGPKVEALKQGEWVLLADTSRASWYRVLALTEYDKAAFSRDVTLAGPDWTNASPKAVIVPRVVSVHTRTVRLTADAPY